ncbi:uncharacterized protein LOC142103524 [Mixophyes fleayi]|uniref:uncharacterized protein LOC142103524 n=1 Tax=Mixophyes fleayi TaxID=3061075 RepID=UPI003F4D72A3
MRPSDILYLLLIPLIGADALRVTMNKPFIEAMREEDVTIPCDISDFEPGRTITVLWSRILNGSKIDVYDNIPGSLNTNRPGAFMVESEIKKGNAELHILRVQFSDEGEYTCTVIVTPDKAEGKSALEVSARPSATLTPGDISIELGTEKSVLCEVTNFYPQLVVIRWVRHSKDPPGCVALDRGTCTSVPATNGDKTFNVTSHLTLNPTRGDDGNKYSCIVTHRSLDTELVRNFTLTVTEREDNTGAVIGAVIGTLISTLLLVAAVLFYFTRFKKDPPILSEIMGNKEIIDMTRTTLTCQIMNFRPNDIKISVRLRRGEEMRIIHSWRSRDHTPPALMTRDSNTGGDPVIIDVDEHQGLINGAVNHEERPLQIEMVPVIKPRRFGSFICECSIPITPSIEDNGSELSVEVSHPALTSPVCVRRRLNVIGVAPKLLTIMAPECLIHDEMVTLTCPINGFKPRALSIIWLKKDQNNQETELVTCDSTGTIIQNNKYLHNVKEIEHDDKSYSLLSALRMKPNVYEDEGVKYICRTHHPATRRTAEQELDMEVTARPVLDNIQKTQTTVSVGDQMDLSCRIHSFYPARIQVTWYKEDGTQLPSRTSDPLSEGSNLCYVTSTMNFKPTIKDVGKIFRCQVQHDSLVEPKSVTWTLTDLISAGSVSDIKCHPEDPEIGKPVTLSCMISDMCLNSYETRWHLRGSRVDSKICKNYIQEDPESGMSSGPAELTLTPTIEHHGAEFRLDVIKMTETVKKYFTMSLRGIPILSKISSDPNNPSYGRPLTLRCNVIGCRREDIMVDWLENDKQLERHRATVTVEKESLSCVLNITPTAEDYGKHYTCSVTHKDITEPIRKQICLSLPDKPPSLSDIIAQPARPEVGKETSLTATISGFSPREIQVRWYKGFSTFPSNAVTSSDLRIGADSLYTCSSTLRFTPERSDHNTSIRCEVTHTVTKSIREKHYNLRLAGEPDPVDGSRKTSQSPKDEKRFEIRGIECVTERPRVGEEVTLRCNVGGCDEDDSMFSWYKGIFPIDGEMENRNLEDGSGSFSTVTFKAEESDRNCTIRFEACYNYQTIEGTFTLTLEE